MIWAWVCVFCQHLFTGMVTRAIVQEQWLAVFVFAITQQTMWWVNMGLRIDAHGSKSAAAFYVFTSSAGVAVGAWLWR
jgi:hypothetical protein